MMDHLLKRIDSRKFQETCKQNVRIPIYCALVLACSLVNLSEEYKIDKSNILNQWFVKLGWFWTCAISLPVIFSGIRTDDKTGVSTAIFRLVLSSILWFVSVNFFQLLDSTTGFDISGHTFLLIFSNLLITSEMRLSAERPRSELPGGNLPLEPLKLSLSLLTILWDFMLLQTALYYHTVLQKAIAALWAIGSWYLLHIIFYEEQEVTALASAKGSEKKSTMGGDQRRGRGADLSTTEH